MTRKPKPLVIPTPEPEAVALALPNAMSYDQWLELGRDIAHKRRSIDWMVGDWITFGREHFPEQIQEALPGFLDDDRAIRRIEKTVKAFPPHMRDASLSFDHHAHVADMPTQEALPLLKRASSERITARNFRIVAMLRKVETSQILPREEDAEDDALMAMVRAWNRAPHIAREDFAIMVRESQGGLIEFEPSKDE
jgi:hypothetical protein